MKTFDECCHEVAKKHGLGQTLVTGHRAVYFTEAAHLYAQEKLKGLLEVAKQEAAQWQNKSDKETDISNKAAYSMTAHAVNRIATRIEELIEQPTTTNQSGN